MKGKLNKFVLLYIVFIALIFIINTYIQILCQEIPCKSDPRPDSIVPLIYCKSILGQPKLLYLPKKPHLRNCILIYHNSIQLIHTQIFIRNSQLILPVIDRLLKSAVNFPHTDPQQESAID